ncbi:MAG: hypothetical protein DDT25_00526 [Chloroflexi bacterium]|nr:hypothetical protein [Chloroflexota bacterium]
MRTLSAPLSAYLATRREIIKADLLTITLSDSTTIRATSFDIDLMHGGNVFKAGQPMFERGRCRHVRGVEIDELEITFYPQDGDTLSGLPFAVAARLGALDTASIRLDVAYLQETADPSVWTVVGTIMYFVGTVGDVEPDRLEVNVKVNSPLQLLNVKMPRNLYQPTCGHTLYGQGCGISRATFQTNRSVQATPAPTVTSFTINAGAEAAGYFDGGVVQITSGAHSGLRRTVKQHSLGGGLTFALPWPAPLAAGVSLQLVPGCDRRRETCADRFSNLARFRGFPYIPTPETIYG